MKDLSCINCMANVCTKDEDKKNPFFCPMGNSEIYQEALEIIKSEKYKNFYKESSKIEKDGYGTWPRIKETLVLIKRMGYTRIGLAYCKGLKKEAGLLNEYFRENGIDLIGFMCKTGGIDKSQVEIKENEKLRPNNFEAMCNPVAQALLLNKEKTELNIVFGLCVGHDALFTKFSEAPSTCLLVKDRALGHNPCLALYQKDGYMKKRLEIRKEEINEDRNN